MGITATDIKLRKSQRLTDFADGGGRMVAAEVEDGVLNNLFVTTFFLREYHYQKQKANAFYHVQTANLPFQNFEFHYLP